MKCIFGQIIGQTQKAGRHNANSTTSCPECPEAYIKGSYASDHRLLRHLASCKVLQNLEGTNLEERCKPCERGATGHRRMSHPTAEKRESVQPPGMSEIAQTCSDRSVGHPYTPQVGWPHCVAHTVSYFMGGCLGLCTPEVLRLAGLGESINTIIVCA